MRKTIKIKPVASYSAASTDSVPDTYVPSEDAVTYGAPTIDDVQNETETRNQRVNQLLDKMNGVSGDDSKLADYTPPPPPAIMSWKDADSHMPVQHMPIPKIQAHNDSLYMPSYSDTKYSNYGASYDPSTMVYGAAREAANRVGMSAQQFQTDSRVLEKINYMIRMLENQAVEKTANITEEFILYTFLGVFVIFVLDSFVRVGKYVR